MSREALYRRIKEELKKESGLKARVIARRLSVERRDVNSILYCMEYREQFRRDDSYRWYLADSESTHDDAQLNDIPVMFMRRRELTEEKSSPVTCKKCMLYKNDTCFGAKNICSFFKNSPDIPEDEMMLWPKEMSGPYGTLHC